MKMVELLIGYDMEKVYSGDISIGSTDMVTDIHVKSDDELTSSERRQFETELSELICKHFVNNKRINEHDLLKRQYLVKDVLEYAVNYSGMLTEEEVYTNLSGGDPKLLKKFMTGEIPTVSRTYLFSYCGFSYSWLDKFESSLNTVKSNLVIKEEQVSSAAIRHVFMDILGMSSDECLSMLKRHNRWSSHDIFIEDYDYLVPLSEIQNMFYGLDRSRDQLVALMVNYTKDHPIG
ncbi:hypothetical protein OBP_025 [Pseudomonas phage OBP]|uniref:hypothetical protein n=1 Tax=Pseudomonas phage OBP TaxID=1124849 RepID=UPI000240D616|nr:hypothetical protein OBP_025 [Pseudomonas phage OBP]AEV89462.1 hypothetical protein OBP_025 [Pseudomonas phage OBP]